MLSPYPLGQLRDLQFDNLFLRELPADPESNGSSREVLEAAYSFVSPTTVAEPRLLAWSRDAAALLGLGDPVDAALAAQVFSGNQALPGMQPYASCYGGHQFGSWAGQLGDGRAIMLGEAVGRGGQHWEIQLKGAGKTPYSRWADGRAVLRSSLREYLCSEAMHYLGIPTTRALCLVGTGEGVERDMFYDGHPRIEAGAVLTRLAPSFLRIGHYEIHAARGDYELLQRMLDHTIRAHFAELGAPSRATYLAWFEEVCRRTAVLMAQWMRVGFVHGVMNTDNLSVLGLTIDYGPYGWLDGFDPAFTPNTTDRSGRYCYANQPHVGAWNLACLAQALMPLVDDVDALKASLGNYQQTFETTHIAYLRDKLGLAPQCDAAIVAKLAEELFVIFAMAETDMTIFFRRLGAAAGLPPAEAAPHLAPAFYTPLGDLACERLLNWLMHWKAQLATSMEESSARRARMDGANPWIIPRNWLAQQAIDAAEQGDMAILERLMAALREPYTERAEFADLAGRRPDWARDAPGCSALSCSS